MTSLWSASAKRESGEEEELDYNEDDAAHVRSFLATTESPITLQATTTLDDAASDTDNHEEIEDGEINEVEEGELKESDHEDEDNADAANDKGGDAVCCHKLSTHRLNSYLCSRLTLTQRVDARASSRQLTVWRGASTHAQIARYCWLIHRRR